MDWFTRWGVLSRLTPGAPALAFDMAVNSMDDSDFPATLGYLMASTSTVMEPYPAPGMDLGIPMGG